MTSTMLARAVDRAAFDDVRDNPGRCEDAAILRSLRLAKA